MKYIYNKTHFTIINGGKEFDFTIDSLPSSSPFNKPFAILTAHNPQNTPLSLEENTQRNAELFKTLMASDYLFDSALGYLDDHSEESYCIYEITFDDAISIAKKYDQYSIFYRGVNSVGYYETNTLKAITQRKCNDK